jgi:hypothetical protein
MSFEGGEVVEGLFPGTTDPSLSLLADPSDDLAPGAASLMSFGVEPEDATPTAALVQFGDSESYFLIDDSGFVGAAADGGVGHIGLSYKVDRDVCKDLCDTRYDIDFAHALRLLEEVGKRGTSTIVLDCIGKGNRERCAKGQGTDAPVLREKDSSVPMPARDASDGMSEIDLPDAGRNMSIADAGSDKADAGVDAGSIDTGEDSGTTGGGTSSCFGTLCQCQDKIEGVYAVKIEMDVWWQDEVNGTNELTDPGRGKINLYFKNEITDVNQVTGVGTSHMRVCGLEMPPQVSSASCAAVQMQFPDALWDSSNVPVLQSTSSITGFEPGDLLTVTKTLGFLGLSLNNGAAFPGSDDTVLLACPEGTGTLWGNGQNPSLPDAPCFPDQDGDGNPGITATFKSDMTQIQGPGYGCGVAPLDLSYKFTFNGAPLGLLSVLPGPTTGARAGWIGLETEAGSTSTINSDCASGVGTASTGAGLPMRLLHCTQNGGSPCTHADSAFVDKNVSNYHVLLSGEAPPADWKFGSPLNDTKSGLLDRSMSKGPRSSVVRLGDVGTTFTCSQVRAASFPAFK